MRRGRILWSIGADVAVLDCAEMLSSEEDDGDAEVYSSDSRLPPPAVRASRGLK